jgi:hypothetical protein
MAKQKVARVKKSKLKIKGEARGVTDKIGEKSKLGKLAKSF